MTKHRRKESKINENEAKSTKEMIPIIKCKRKSYNFYQNQSYRKNSPILLASKGWSNKKSRGDYFFIYPPDTVLFICNCYSFWNFSNNRDFSSRRLRMKQTKQTNNLVMIHFMILIWTLLCASTCKI